jgi:hypothetical protein
MSSSLPGLAIHSAISSDARTNANEQFYLLYARGAWSIRCPNFRGTALSRTTSHEIASHKRKNAILTISGPGRSARMRTACRGLSRFTQCKRTSDVAGIILGWWNILGPAKEIALKVLSTSLLAFSQFFSL